MQTEEADHCSPATSRQQAEDSNDDGVVVAIGDEDAHAYLMLSGRVELPDLK